MKKPLIYQAAREIGKSVAFIWRQKAKRGMDPDAAQAVFREVVVALEHYERDIYRRVYQKFAEPHNN